MKLKKILAAAIAVTTLGVAVPTQPMQKLLEDFSLTASAEGAITQNTAVVINSSNKSTYEGKTITGTVPSSSFAGNNGSFVSKGAVVVDGIELSLTLNGFNTDYSARNDLLSGISLINGAMLHLTVKGTNDLIAGFGGAGISVPDGCTLEITAQSDGILNASGGNSYGGGAGIGSIGDRDNTNQALGELLPQGCGTIIINGGTINAKGGTWYDYSTPTGGAAGIGSSEFSGASTSQKFASNEYINKITGDITINGGTVTATGGCGAAGIGGGSDGTVKTITINNGDVTVNAGAYSSAIGLGVNGFSTESSGTLTIPVIELNNGTVTVNGSIGSESPVGSSSNKGGSIYISKDINLTYSGNISAENIKRMVTISFNANGGTGTMDTFTVEADKEFIMPACGFTPPAGKRFRVWQTSNVGERSANSKFYPSEDVTFNALWISNDSFYSAVFDPNGGTGTMDPMNYARGNYVLPSCSFLPPEGKIFSGWQIGNSVYYPGNKFDLSGDMTIKALWENKTQWNGSVYIDADTTIDERVIISGNAVLEIADGKTLTLSKGINVTGNNSITVKGSGTLKIDSCPDNCAGIGGNDDQDCGTVIIDGCTITVKGGKYAAGIGGGKGGKGGTITINGGSVNTTGGEGTAGITKLEEKTGAGAGIGGGTHGSSGNITINGGTVNAVGGFSDVSYGGAGIGGGWYADADTITINDGNITAKTGSISSQYMAAKAIGGTFYHNGGTIAINGGQVNVSESITKATQTLIYLFNQNNSPMSGKRVFSSASIGGIGAGPQSTEGTGDGPAIGDNGGTCNISLGWSRSTDYINVRTSYRGTVTFKDPFSLDGESTDATTENITGKKIVPKGCISVFFNANGHGTAPEEIGLKSVGKVTKPADPTAEGYEFGGWYQEAECKNSFNFDTTISQNTTLFAKWTAKSATEPIIDSQPQNITLNSGYSSGSKLSVSAHSASDAEYTISYQWYSNSSNSTSGGTALSGKVDSSFEIPTGLSIGNHYYYCIVTAKRNDNTLTATKTSSVACVKIEKVNANVRITAGNSLSKTYGEDVFTLTASASEGTNGVWTWESSDTNAATVTSDAKTSTVTIKKAKETPITIKVTYTSDTTMGSATLSLTIYKRAVMITGLSASNREYNGNTTASIAGTADIDGKIGNDDLTVTTGTASFEDKNVGTDKTVTFSGFVLGGTAKNNYTLSAQPASVTADITAKSVTISGITASNKEYDGKTDATLDYTNAVFTGIISGDTLTVTAKGKFKNADAGDNKTVNISDLTLDGTDKDNYVLAASGQQTSTTAKIIQATFDNKTAIGRAFAGTSGEVDLSSLIDSGCTLGTITKTDTNSILNELPTLSSGKLSFEFVNNNEKANKTATVKVPVSCDNYKYDIVVTVTVVAAPVQDTNDTTGKTYKWETSTGSSTSTITLKSDTENSNTPTLQNDGSLTLEGKGSVEVGSAECKLESTSGTTTLNPNTDEMSSVSFSGVGSITLGTRNIPVTTGQTAYISDDGINVRVVDSSTGKTTFYEKGHEGKAEVANGTKSVDGADIKGVEVNENSASALTTGETSLTGGIVSTKQIIGLKALFADGRNVNNTAFNKPVTIYIPLSGSFSSIRGIVLRYINEALSRLELVKSEIVTIDGKQYIKATLNHFSNYVAAQATGLNVKIGNHDYGTIKINNGVDNADLANAKSGDEITVDATPNSGYRLSSLSYTGAVSGTVTIAGNKFTMPGEDVTVNAVFTRNSGGGSYTDYTYKTIDGIGYRIHPTYVGVYEGDKDSENMVIKSEIEGKPVTTIEAGSFNSFKKMKSITLPDTLTTIEQGAFWGCAALEEIDIPETVTKIESNAFAYCSNLKKLIVRNKDCSIAMYNNTLYNDYKSSKYQYDGVIVGYVGSTAEKYATKFKYTFEDIEKVVVTTTATSTSGTKTTTTTTTVSTTAASGTTTPVTTLKIGVVNDPKIDNSGKITWSKAENAVQYCVAKIVGGKKYYGATVTENSYTFNSIPNEDYKFYVIAIGEDGRYTTGKVLDVKVAKPVGKAAAPTVDKDGNVTWKAVKNAVKYKVVKKVNDAYYGGSEVMETSYKLDSVPANDYQVYILSYGENGAYTVGEKTSVKVDNPIEFVNDVKVDNSGKVSWSKATKAVEYRVVKMIGDKKYYGSITPRTYYHFDSIPNEDYKLYVIAMGADGRYTTGKVLSVKVNAVGKAAAPTVAKDGTVSWKAVDNAVKYKVVKKVNDSYYGGSEVTETSYKLNNLPVSDYQIYVLSYGENGAMTVGEKTTVKVDKPLGFVNDVKVDKNGKVTWSKAQNAASYCVVKVFNGKKYYGAETKTNSYQFEKSCYKDYQVYVIAYGANKNYTVGKRVTVEVGDLGVVLDPKVDKNGKVSWSAVRGAVKYKVYKVVGDNKAYGVTTDTTYTFKNVPTTDYSVYVVAFDKNGKYRVGTTKTVNP